MAKIISIHSFRGGAGKSNVTANLAALLAQNSRVAVVDTDIQSPGVHVIFNYTPGPETYALNHYLWGECSLAEAAHDITESVGVDPAHGALYLVPSSITSTDIGRILREGYDVSLITEGLESLLDDLKLDYLLVDTHPGVNEETLLSVAISDILLLMMRPDRQDFQGTAVTIELATRIGVPRIIIGLNKVPPSMNAHSLREHVEQTFGESVGCVLPLNFEIAELGSGGLFTQKYPMHPWTSEIELLVDQIIEEE